MRRVFWPIAWLLLFTCIGIVIGYSQSYTKCVHEHKNLREYNNLHQNTESSNEIIERELVRLKLQATCASQFAEDNEHAINALAAVALAVFTFYLWRATRGLRSYAEIQARDMRQLVRLARANALAGMRAARAARTSANAAMVQANMAERSFFDLERPYLFADSFEGDLETMHTTLPQGTIVNQDVHTVTYIGNIPAINLPVRFNSNYSIKNWGRTPAVIYEKQFYTIFAHALPLEVHYQEPIERGERVVGPGELERGFRIESYQFRFAPEERQNFIDGSEKRVMFVFGFIRYKDVFGNKYVRGHAVRYLRRLNRFVVAGGDAYNYEHKEN
jgi:hypothetical protein